MPKCFLIVNRKLGPEEKALEMVKQGDTTFSNHASDLCNFGLSGDQRVEQSDIVLKVLSAIAAGDGIRDRGRKWYEFLGHLIY